MKILHVSSWFQPRLGYSEFYLPKAQQALGHEVAVLTSDRFYPFPNYAATVKPLLGERIVGAGERTEQGLRTFRSPVRFEYRHHMMLTQLRRWLDVFAPDAVHIHEAFTLPVVQVATAHRSRRFDLLIASSMEPEVFYPQSLSRRVYYWLHRQFAAPLLRSQVNVFTAVSVGARGVLERQLRLGSGHAQVVPLGADSDIFKPDSTQRATVRAHLGIADDVVLVTYAGKLIREKDVHVLAEAFAGLPPHLPAALLLLGNGAAEYVTELKQLLGPTRERARFLPPVPNAELAAYFCATDIAVWPSQSSNAAVEAAMCAVPIIVNDAPTVAHYIAGDNGLSFRRGDIAQLRSLLVSLVTDHSRRRALGQNGRIYGAATLSWTAIAKKYLELYGQRPARFGA